MTPNEVFAAVSQFNDELFSRKAGNWREVWAKNEQAVRSRFDAAIWDAIPVFSYTDVYAGAMAGPCDEFSDEFIRNNHVDDRSMNGMDVDQMLIFIICSNTTRYLINTEGAKYARYALRLT